MLEIGVRCTDKLDQSLQNFRGGTSFMANIRGVAREGGGRRVKPPLVEIGLTDRTKTGEAKAQPPLATGLLVIQYYELSHCYICNIIFLVIQ